MRRENKNPFNLENTEDAFLINDNILLYYSYKYDRLTKIQKALIQRLAVSPLMGSNCDIVRLCGLKTNNMTMNYSQILQLEKYNIISINKFVEDDLKDILTELQCKVNSRTKTYRLNKNWVDNLCKVDFGETINNRLQY